MIQKQANSCKSKAFTSLVDRAEIKTQADHYKVALDLYWKAYRICPMKDMEEKMDWLIWEVGDEDNNKDGRL